MRRVRRLQFRIGRDGLPHPAKLQGIAVQLLAPEAPEAHLLVEQIVHLVPPSCLSKAAAAAAAAAAGM
jgi:hypothetical protein